MTVAELKSAPPSQTVPFESTLIVKRITEKTAKNGSGFLAVEMGDRTGVFHLVCFENSATYDFFKESQAGIVVKAQGATGYYQDRFSPKINHVEKIDLSDLQANEGLDALVERSPEDPDALWQEIGELIEKIGRAKLRETVRAALSDVEEDFRSIPAAVSMHHAYRYGLLEHTTRVARAANTLLPLYPGVDADLALAGAILHDIGKTLEYTNDLATRRTRLGILQGHVALGYRIVRRAAMLAKLEEPLLERLEHIILSHQGELEWGAAAMAATPEAVFVSMIDNLDAKMGMTEHALRNVSENEEFSEYMAGLSAPVLATPPDGPAEKESKEKQPETEAHDPLGDFKLD